MVHSRLRLAILLTTLWVWMGGLLTNTNHQTAVLHVTCLEHGQVVELNHAAQDDPADAPGDHDHDCALVGFVGHASLPPIFVFLAPIVEDFTIEETAFLPQLAARPPPLVYAPKTSPPVSVWS